MQKFKGRGTEYSGVQSCIKVGVHVGLNEFNLPLQKYNIILHTEKAQTWGGVFGQDSSVVSLSTA